MAGRGRRSLTPEEGRLWHEVTASARPLHGISTPDLPPPVEQAVLALPPAPRPEPAPARPLQPKQPPPAAPALDRAHPHMDRRRFDKLRRGRLDPEARIDLHGMTLAVAQPALTRFVLQAQGAGKRLVLVITGKGREGGPDAPLPVRPGALRHNVPHWLHMPPLNGVVLQVRPAHRRHGGDGAYYVYLRK